MNSSFLEQFDKYKTSQSIALVCGNTSLTYAELYKRCSALASKLRSLGVGICSTEPEFYDIFCPKEAMHSPWVVIISDRSVNAVIGVIATFIAGGAYVLVGADAPDAYVDDILEDTAASVVLRNGDFDAESGESIKYTYPKENEIACAIFTSGSTGKPKGAVLEHRALNEIIKWQTEYMNPTRLVSTAAYAPFSFIAAIWEIFFPLANGLTLHILEENTRRDLFALQNCIENNNISYIFLPPNIAEVFTQTYCGSALKYLRVAGGRLKSCGDPGGRYEIMYHLGMAENGGSVTMLPIREAMNGDIPIGKPWNNTQVYLVSETGEMAVSGPTLFRGYLSRREETLRKRVKNPYSNEPGYEMIYLSGDLVRMNDNAEFIHMGRNDWEVKIRDMKVNPMQVENVISECPGVTECCVTAQTLDGENTLIGWIVGVENEDSLRSELSARLPEYMIPSIFVNLSKLPRNVNGKVDRSALIYTQLVNEDASPSGMSDSEAKIAALFGRVLGCPASFIGAEDNFLRLGGNSLKFMRLQVEISRELSKNVPYEVLFSNPTPRMLANLLHEQDDNTSRHILPAAPMEYYPLSAPMRQMWLLWRTGQDRGKYTLTLRCRFTGEIDRLRVKACFDELVRRNAILRSRFEERDGDVFQIVEDSVNVLICEYPQREFDLSAAPVFSVSIQNNILILTTHHIIADAMGINNFMEDFWILYSGGELQHGAQVHDITMWSLENDASSDENYWLNMFFNGVPSLELPYDFPRPVRLNTTLIETVYFNKSEAAWLNEYTVSHNATLFQLFMTAFAFLISKLSGCGSMVIGVPLAGREHPDTARTIGMLVRTLPIRLDISGMSFDEALEHVRERFITGRDHQNVSLARLSEIIEVPRTAARNPFYDVMVNYAPLPRVLPDTDGLRPEILRGEYPGSLFDLVLDLREEMDGYSAVFTYADELFKPETIRRWTDAYKKLLLTHESELEYTYSPIPVRDDDEAAAAVDESLLQMCELLCICKDVLGIEDISSGGDFFKAGGTSLAAIRIEAALFEKGWLLSAADIFQNPGFYEMAALMSRLEEIDWEDDEA